MVTFVVCVYCKLNSFKGMHYWKMWPSHNDNPLFNGGDHTWNDHSRFQKTQWNVLACACNWYQALFSTCIYSTSPTYGTSEGCDGAFFSCQNITQVGMNDQDVPIPLTLVVERSLLFSAYFFLSVWFLGVFYHSMLGAYSLYDWRSIAMQRLEARVKILRETCSLFTSCLSFWTSCLRNRPGTFIFIVS